MDQRGSSGLEGETDWSSTPDISARMTALFASRPGSREMTPSIEIDPVRPSRPRIRIWALGRFTVRANDAPLASHRSRLRPMELLKCILAAGGCASRQRLIECLWPEDDGDVAKTLEINVHRLRRLLGCNDAVLAADGRVTLNPQVCWVDVAALEAAIAQAEACPVLARAPAMEALRLYNGHLLEHEDDRPWLIWPRERLRNRFVSIAERLAHSIDVEGDFAMSIEVHRLTIARDPINEVFNCGLIVALERAGRRAEALATYQRFERLLRVAHDTVPSLRARCVFERLRRG